MAVWAHTPRVIGMIFRRRVVAFSLFVLIIIFSSSPSFSRRFLVGQESQK
jgi:hypothetical protein